MFSCCSNFGKFCPSNKRSHAPRLRLVHASAEKRVISAMAGHSRRDGKASFNSVPTLAVVPSKAVVIQCREQEKLRCLRDVPLDESCSYR